MTSAAISAHEARPDRLKWFLYIVGGITLANALWMLAGPMHWYTELPAAVPDTGPFNPHFVRDIGCAFLTTAIALVWAGRNPAHRLPLVAIAALFLAAHAILHAYDTMRGALGHNHWLLDLPGVYLPGLLLPWVAFRLAFRPPSLSPSRPPSLSPSRPPSLSPSRPPSHPDSRPPEEPSHS